MATRLVAAKAVLRALKKAKSAGAVADAIVLATNYQLHVHNAEIDRRLSKLEAAHARH